MVDVSQHEFVPDHTVLDEGALEDILEEYNITKTDLPKIKRTDPALQDVDAGVGDAIRIERDSRTTETAVVYRLVVE
jgi:DNA-directed RNA polymerase subunit H